MDSLVAHPSRRPLRGLLRMRSVLLKQSSLMLRSASAHSDAPSARVSKHGPQRGCDSRLLGNEDVPAFHEGAVAAGCRLDADLLAEDVDRSTGAHLDRPLGAVDFDDHCIAGILGIGRDAVVETVEAGLVPTLEDRLPMASAGADTPSRHLDPDGIAGNAHRRSRAAESLLLRHINLHR